MTPAWKALAIAALQKKGWSREHLAKELGVDRGLMYRILPVGERDNEIWGSALVPRMCELLGLPPPLVPTEMAKDERDRQIMELVRALPPETKDSLIEFISGLLRRPRS